MRRVRRGRAARCRASARRKPSLSGSAKSISATVIWNGVSPARPSAHHKSRFILAAGRMCDPAKNIMALARASTGLDWPVLVAGPTSAPFSELTLLGDLSRSALRDLRRAQDIWERLGSSDYRRFDDLALAS